jgi:hypothetical protein
MPNLASTIRAAIAADKRSQNAIAKAADVPAMTLSDFMRGREIGIDKASRLAALLGLELRRKKSLASK